jgi:hypothetical protein
MIAPDARRQNLDVHVKRSLSRESNLLAGSNNSVAARRAYVRLVKAGATGFDGNRWNDLHYTRAFNVAAREGRSDTWVRNNSVYSARPTYRGMLPSL